MRFRSAAASLLLAALSASAAGAQTASPCPAAVPGDAACYAGRDDQGATYWIARPKAWNGVLIVHAHGGPRLRAPKPSTSAADLARFAVMVREGYAWIGSSYRRGGYGVRRAAEDTEHARRLFVAAFGRPRRTIAHGQSWGGNVAAKLIELYATEPGGAKAYDGALLTSGVIGGGTVAYAFRADLRAVYQYYCGNHPRPDEPQYPLWMGLPADATLRRKELEQRVDACTGVKLPEARRSEQQRRNLANILAVVRIPEQTLVAHLAWGTYHFRDLVQRVLGGRNPFSNEGVRYAGSTDDAALNHGVARFRADPAAVAQLADDSDLTGAIAVPVVTLHAIDDPTVFVEHESRYRELVDRAGKGGLLVQTFTRERVHSALHTPQVAAVLDALLTWIEQGIKPTPETIAAACERYKARYGSTCAFDPTYRSQPFSARSYPR